MVLAFKTPPCPGCCGRQNSNCSFDCQSIVGTASLCGFAPFGTDDGRRFKSLVTSGTIYLGEWSASPCTAPPAPVNASGSFSSTHGGVTATLQYTYTFQGIVGGFLQWTLKTVVTYTGSPYAAGQWVNTSTPNTNQPGGIAIGTNSYNINANTSSSTGWHHQLTLSADGSLGGQVQKTIDLAPPGNLINSYRDDWNRTETYNPTPTCALTDSNSNARHQNDNSNFAFPLTTGGTPVGLPTQDPTTAYDPALVAVGVMPTQQTVNGLNSCTLTGGNYWSAQGTATATLSSEDTPQDAIGRAVSGLSYQPSKLCVSSIQARNPGSTSFGFVKSQVKATFKQLTIGANYAGYIVFQSRPTGSTQPWKTVSQYVVDFTASAVTDSTGWVDIPLIDGQEVQAGYCYAIPNP